MKPNRKYFESMRDRALSKLDGEDGLRVWMTWAKLNLPREYACREQYKRWQEAESNLKIAEIMLNQSAHLPGCAGSTAQAQECPACMTVSGTKLSAR